MAYRNTYRLAGQAQNLLQSFPLGNSADTVLISIYDADDNTADVTEAAMTHETGVSWGYAWTPTESHNFIIKYDNQTIDVQEYEYVKVAGEIVGVPGGAGVGSTLTVLQKSLLLALDNYNANDLTGDGSSGDQATRSINKALQKIYSMLKNNRYLQAYGSSALSSTADQAYIELSGISDLDEITAMKDATNNVTLQYIEPWKYFQTSDPAEITGVPFQYTRIFNRAYLRPTPTAVINYVTEYRKTYADLSAGGDVALIPSKYNYWILAEAAVEWYAMQDAYNVPQIVLAERDRNKDIAMGDLMSDFNKIIVADNHFGNSYGDLYWRGFTSPMNQ